jgi:hypothetical protein
MNHLAAGLLRAVPAVKTRKEPAMRTIVLAGVVALGSSAVIAGPSDHMSRRLAEPSRAERAENQTRPAPYALTGERVQRRVLQFRDVPQGRGQTQQMPYWTWVSE